MNDAIRKVNKAYSAYWRKIPSFPMYEMNLLGEVRDVRHKQVVNRINRRTYSLYRDGKFHTVSGKSLYEGAFPLTELP